MGDEVIQEVGRREPWRRSDIIQAVGVASAILLLGLNAFLWFSQQSNFRNERRAWVGAIEGRMLAPEIAPGVIPSFEFILRNTGQTPAL